MASIFFMPRRGTKYKMNHTSKSSLILKEGELFVECPDSGVGTGPSKIKIGDGITAYSALPYALGADNDYIEVEFDEITTGDFNQNYRQIVSGISLGLFAALVKRCLYLLNQSISGFATIEYVDNKIANTIRNYYTKTEIDAKFSNYYTKNEINNISGLTNYYDKTYIDQAISTLDTKFNNYYTKTQSDGRYYTQSTINSWFKNE